MNPLNVGILEILVILALALVLFGPTRLISVVGSLRGAVQEFQRATRGLASSAMEEAKAESGPARNEPVGFQSEDKQRTKASSAGASEPHKRSGPEQL